MSIKATDLSFSNTFGAFVEATLHRFCKEGDHPACDSLLSSEQLTFLFYTSCSEGRCESVLGIKMTPPADFSRYPVVKVSETDAAAAASIIDGVRARLKIGPWDKFPDPGNARDVATPSKPTIAECREGIASRFAFLADAKPTEYNRLYNACDKLA